MPQNDPLNALRKATSISSNPSSPDPSLISRGEMPVPPFPLHIGGIGEPWGKIMSGVDFATPRYAKIVPDALQGLRGALNPMSEASTYTGPVAETLGEVDPFHTPVGGEGLYNVARAGLRGIVDPVEEAYRALLSRGGK